VWGQGELVWICGNAWQPEAQSEILAADLVIGNADIIQGQNPRTFCFVFISHLQTKILSH
jgi:hypothetical protein